MTNINTIVIIMVIIIKIILPKSPAMTTGTQYGTTFGICGIQKYDQHQLHNYHHGCHHQDYPKYPPQISSDDDRDSIRRDIWCLWDPRWRQQLLIYIDLAPTNQPLPSAKRPQRRLAKDRNRKFII